MILKLLEGNESEKSRAMRQLIRVKNPEKRLFAKPPILAIASDCEQHA